MIEKCERIRMPRLSEFKRIGGWKETEQALNYHKIKQYAFRMNEIRLTLC